MRYRHTPWAVRGEDRKVVDKNGDTVALVAYENINHAMLIAAAPLMLEALKRVVEESKTGFASWTARECMMNLVKAAINAAEGKASNGTE